MHILFGWGKSAGPESLKYVVNSYNLALTSGEDFVGGLGNCVPGEISVSLEIPPSQKEKPATDLLKFAKTQHDTAKNDGAGKIVVYEGRDVGQPIQEIVIEKAWISSIGTSVSKHDQQFVLQLSISAAKIQISDVSFEDRRKLELVA